MLFSDDSFIKKSLITHVHIGDVNKKKIALPKCKIVVFNFMNWIRFVSITYMTIKTSYSDRSLWDDEYLCHKKFNYLQYVDQTYNYIIFYVNTFVA